MRHMRYVTLVLIFGCMHLVHASIPEKFETFTSSEGLSNNYIRCIDQDVFGYIWIGTKFGLNRFNGYNFEVYQNVPQDSLSLINNSVNHVFSSHDSLVWLATNGGIAYFDYRSWSFKEPEIRDKENKLLDNKSIHFHEFYSASDSTLWITSEEGVFKRLTNQEVFVKYDFGKNSNRNIARILKRTEEEFWFSLHDTLCRMNTKSGETKKFYHDPADESSFSGFFIYNIFEYNNDVYITTGGGGINKYIENTDSFEHYSFKDGIVDIKISRDGLFYMATWEGGLVVFDPESRTFSDTEYQPFKENGISSNSLTCIFFDNNNSLWIGTSGNGVNKHDPFYWNFNHLSYQISGNFSLSHGNVRAVMVDDNKNLWIGTEGGGLNKYNFNKDEYEYFKSEHSSDQKKSNQIVLSLIQDTEGKIWVGTIAGLNRVNLPAKTYQSIGLIKPELHALSKLQIWKMEKDATGKIWLGTDKGLVQFDPVNLNYSFVKSSSLKADELLKSGVTSVYPDGQDLWVGTKKGVCKYLKASDHFITFQHRMGDSSSLSNSSVNTIGKDHWGNIWIGTDYGLNKFNPTDQTFVHFTKKDGLSDNRIISILMDDHGNFWISGNNGITFLNTKSHDTRIYTVRDGLLMKNYNPGAFYKDDAGRLYFGGIKGIDYFHPDKILKNLVTPEVYINQMFISNNNQNADKAGQTVKKLLTQKEVKLKYNQNFFNIHFEAINFTRSANNRYAYQLEGFDKGWIESGFRKTAYYSGVPPGEYNFRVIASNNDYVWNREGDILKIIITPPFWKTWYAFVIYFLVFLGLFYLGNKYTLIGVKLKNDLLLNKLQKEKVKEIYDAKMRFFMNISHEFRTPLSLIIAPLEDVLNRLPIKSSLMPKLEIAYRNSNKMLNLVNQLLELRTIETGTIKLHLRKTNILNAADDAMKSFHEVAIKRNIRFELKTNLSSLDVWMDPEKIDRVLINLLSNAFKFTPDDGRITLYITISRSTYSKNQNLPKDEPVLDEMVKITVEDTGKGIPEDKLETIFERFYQIDDNDRNINGTGIGLALCKELVELHKGTINAESETGIGSRFIVRLPLGKEHFKDDDHDHEISADERSNEIPKFANIPSVITTNSLPNHVSAEEMKTQKAFDNLPELLIVDDNFDIISLLRQRFSEKYSVTSAITATQALEMLKTHLPDIIISDVMMPEMNGIEFCEKVKKNPNTRHIPLIMLTAKNTDADVLKGIKAGADHYISKPFSIELLESKIENVLRGMKTLRSNVIQDLPVDLDKFEYDSPDAKFVRGLYVLVEENLSNPELEVNFIARKMGISRAQLYRKVDELCGQSVKEFVRTIRLKVAAKLLEKGDLRVSEIMYEVGINNRPYFIKRFKELYDTTPSEYMKKHQLVDKQ